MKYLIFCLVVTYHIASDVHSFICKSCTFIHREAHYFARANENHCSSDQLRVQSLFNHKLRKTTFDYFDPTSTACGSLKRITAHKLCTVRDITIIDAWNLHLPSASRNLQVHQLPPQSPVHQMAPGRNASQRLNNFRFHDGFVSLAPRSPTILFSKFCQRGKGRNIAASLV